MFFQGENVILRVSVLGLALKNPLNLKRVHKNLGFSGDTSGKKNPLANSDNIRDTGLIPRSGRSLGEGNSNTLQCSCLDNSMDRGAGRLQSMGSQRAGHDWATNIFTIKIYKRLYNSRFYGLKTFII